MSTLIGAGKSSIALILFRMVEITDGSIYIDDADANEMDLNTLRSQFTIIPQVKMKKDNGVS